MQNLTPDWEVVCERVYGKLLELMDEMDDDLTSGTDPRVVVNDATAQLKTLIETLEGSPEDLN